MMGKILFFLVVLCIGWYVLSAVTLPAFVLLVVAVVCPLLLLEIARRGRQALDQRPEVEAASKITWWVHQGVILLLGSGAIAAVRICQIYPVWEIPVPNPIGLALVAFSGLLLLASTTNLILSGLGIPLAYLQTRKLAADWLYSWTRNPIVLSALLFMLSLGIWLRSATLVAWTLFLLAPAAVILLRVFEERELEIRFGADYMAYRAQVPMLLPRIPNHRRPTLQQHPKG